MHWVAKKLAAAVPYITYSKYIFSGSEGSNRYMINCKISLRRMNKNLSINLCNVCLHYKIMLPESQKNWQKIVLSDWTKHLNNIQRNT